MTRYLTTLCALLLLSGCSRAPAPGNDEAETKAFRDGEVAAFLRDWMAGKDADLIASHYAINANALFPNAPIMTGRDALAKATKEQLTDPNWAAKLRAVEVEASGNLAYIRGAYEQVLTDPLSKQPVTEKGRFLTIFHKQADGSWQAIQDMFNAEAPATPTAK